MITGRGDAPFASRWMRGDVLRKPVRWAADDDALKAAMVDWYFDAQTEPPAVFPVGLINNPVVMLFVAPMEWLRARKNRLRRDQL